jgi:drug/metabolite transporter (DMT)-like permease
MTDFVWPVAIVLVSNVLYQVCAKSVPNTVNPFVSMTVTYVVAGLLSVIMFFVTTGGGSLVRELPKVNWSSFVYGLAIVGLEAGFICAYKAGWEASILSVIVSGGLAVTMLFVGAIAFHETLTWQRILGVVVCLIGLALINFKS